MVTRVEVAAELGADPPIFPSTRMSYLMTPVVSSGGSHSREIAHPSCETILRLDGGESSTCSSKGVGPLPPMPPNQCHPSFQGECVPDGVSDVDCRGGSGNGPLLPGVV
jgi:hypothetical protein